jgi:hypothetical protein
MGKNYSHKQRKRFLKNKQAIMAKTDPHLMEKEEKDIKVNHHITIKHVHYVKPIDSGNYRVNAIFHSMNTQLRKTRDNFMGKNVPENPKDDMKIRQRKHPYGNMAPRPEILENGKTVMLIPCPMKNAEGYGKTQSSVKGKSIHKSIKSRYGKKTKRFTDDRVFSIAQKTPYSHKTKGK